MYENSCTLYLFFSSDWAKTLVHLGSWMFQGRINVHMFINIYHMWWYIVDRQLVLLCIQVINLLGDHCAIVWPNWRCSFVCIRITQCAIVGSYWWHGCNIETITFWYRGYDVCVYLLCPTWINGDIVIWCEEVVFDWRWCILWWWCSFMASKCQCWFVF